MTASFPATGFASKYNRQNANRSFGMASVFNPFTPVGNIIQLPSLATAWTLPMPDFNVSPDQKALVNCVFINIVGQPVRMMWSGIVALNATNGFLLPVGNTLIWLSDTGAMPRFIEIAASATGVYQFGRLD